MAQVRRTPALDEVPRFIGSARIGLGVALMLAPSLASRLYLGAEANRPTVRFTNRLFGGRDVALGVALLLTSAEGPEQVRPALLLGAACDAWDGIAAIVQRDGLSAIGRWVVPTSAFATAALGLAAASGATGRRSS